MQEIKRNQVVNTECFRWWQTQQEEVLVVIAGVEGEIKHK